MEASLEIVPVAEAKSSVDVSPEYMDFGDISCSQSLYIFTDTSAKDNFYLANEQFFEHFKCKEKLDSRVFHTIQHESELQVGVLCDFFFGNVALFAFQNFRL